ncbi:unnamed protein product, partial [Symbiodinium sp. KB8]
ARAATARTRTRRRGRTPATSRTRLGGRRGAAASSSSTSSSSRPGGATAAPTSGTNTPTGTIDRGSARAPARAPEGHAHAEVPDQPTKKLKLSSRVPAGAEVIVPSTPRAIFAWEVDRAAIQVADYNIPGIRHRGDITEDTPEDVAAEVRHIDAQAECMILFTAAPPCQDFSR